MEYTKFLPFFVDLPRDSKTASVAECGTDVHPAKPPRRGTTSFRSFHRCLAQFGKFGGRRIEIGRIGRKKKRGIWSV